MSGIGLKQDMAAWFSTSRLESDMVMHFPEYVKLRHEKHGSVIFDTLREKVFVVNETAGFVSQMLKDGAAEKEILQVVGERFKGQADVIAQDVRDFLDMLKENDLLAKE